MSLLRMPEEGVRLQLRQWRELLGYALLPHFQMPRRQRARKIAAWAWWTTIGVRTLLPGDGLQAWALDQYALVARVRDDGVEAYVATASMAMRHRGDRFDVDWIRIAGQGNRRHLSHSELAAHWARETTKDRL